MAGKAGMPAEVDSAPPAYIESPFKTSFASVSLCLTDRILLTQFPPDDIVAIRDIIKQNWRNGIQAERTHPHSHEFKCVGNPWVGPGSEDIPARILIRSILAYLFSHAWILTASTSVSETGLQKDAMVFRKQVVPPPASDWIAVSFHQGERLRLMGAPAELLAAFREMLFSIGLFQEASWKDKKLDTFEFKVIGWPWLTSGAETNTSRLLLLKMLETLEAGGWSLYATVRQHTSRISNSSGACSDTWYCLKAVDWVPGSSVFHR